MTFLSNTPFLADIELDDAERYAANEPNNVSYSLLSKAILEIRRLQHILDDPNYLYTGTRICRQAIIWRDVEIDKLKKQIKELEALNSN